MEGRQGGQGCDSDPLADHGCPAQPSAQLTTQQCKPESNVQLKLSFPRVPLPSPTAFHLLLRTSLPHPLLPDARRGVSGARLFPRRHSHFAREFLLTRYSVFVAPGNRLHRKETSFPYRSPPRLEPFQPTARPADREARRKPRTKEPGRPPPKEQIACGRALTSANCGAWIPGEIVFTWHI